MFLPCKSFLTGKKEEISLSQILSKIEKKKIVISEFDQGRSSAGVIASNMVTQEWKNSMSLRWLPTILTVRTPGEG